MALPRWITPDGTLGIIPELDYYEFPLVAHDTSGGELKFSLVSGRLPQGLQIVPTGKIQGVPVSELGGDRNVEYRFTVRVQNNITNGLSDRTFSVTVTNIAPPIIDYPPRDSYLGLHLDGTKIDYQLDAVEFTPGANLQWKIKKGDLPPGLRLTPTGLITGYIQPIPNTDPNTIPGWDRSSWNFRSWDFSPGTISKNFIFTVEVFDGVNYDQSSYSLRVFPRTSLTADNTEITIDVSNLGTITSLTTDCGSKHPPIIITQQEDFVPIRQGQHFSFKINALDLDGDILNYSIPAISAGFFDAQGFDTSKFDQGILNLPEGLAISNTSGWVYGIAPTQLVNQIDYNFEVVVFKRDNAEYFDKKLYTLTVLGDLNNKIEWITDSDLGSIENGKISDLTVKARHVSPSGPKILTYSPTPNQQQSFPQGLKLSSNGLLIGRVSFELFGLDSGDSSLDKDNTTFDLTYHFTITAQTADTSISSSKSFKITVIKRNKIPYENLYLKALPDQEQRNVFQTLLQNKTLFPTELIYRVEDPYFGVANDVKTLFLPGLEPSTLSKYTIAASTNHFKKRLVFGEIKTAVALDSNFNAKYEVVYVELKDENANKNGQGPKNSTDLSSIIDYPFHDKNGKEYTTIFPNSFSNMESVMVDGIGYANKGALPDWMTSKQADGRVIGFTRALVLAYTVPNASDLIAYRLKNQQFNFNNLEFVVDRYQLDNSYSDYYNIDAGNFLTDAETTFDRYPKLIDLFIDAGIVNYAVSIPYEWLNYRLVSDINAMVGGLDGIKYFRNGETLVFAQQEFVIAQDNTNNYNQGWANVQTSWDGISWDYDSNLSDNPYTLEYGYIVVPWQAHTKFDAGLTITYNSKYYRVNESFISGTVFELAIVEYGFDRNADRYDQQTFDSSIVLSALTQIPKPGISNKTQGIGWDASNYVPGYQEHTVGNLINQRAGVWQINIDSNQIVTLAFLKEINTYDKLYVTNGRTYGSTNIFYDPVIKTGNTVPNYTMIPQQISTDYTTFDGGGTRFFNYRNEFTQPEIGDKYIKFTKLGVFI
jgi:Putative Ig domain